MTQIFKKIIDCCKCGYEELTDLETKQNLSYDAVKADLDEVREKWETLHKETRTRVQETRQYFSPYVKTTPDASKVDEIKKHAKQLSVEFKTLESRHYKIESEVEVDPALIERRYNDSKTRRDNIAAHGRNALIAAILLGAILAGIITREKYKEIEWIICGALIGAAGVAVIGGLAYFLFRKAADRGVKNWEGLRKQLPSLEEMDKTIEKKTQIVKSFGLLLDAFEDSDAMSIMFGSEELIEQCNKYLDDKLD